MTIPNLPTDNLYKFMCLAGLVTVIVSQIYFANTAFKSMSKRLNADIENTAILIGWRSVSNLVSRLDNEVAAFGTQTNGVTPDQLSRLREGLREIDLRYDRVDEATKNSLKVIAETKVAKAEYEIAEHSVRRVSIFGILLCAVGGMFWYYRIQRYQDMILKNEAEHPHREKTRNASSGSHHADS